jgi:hypothetical protein
VIGKALRLAHGATRRARVCRRRGLWRAGFQDPDVRLHRGVFEAEYLDGTEQGVGVAAG